MAEQRPGFFKRLFGSEAPAQPEPAVPPVPPIPPVPPVGRRCREPIGALILIGFGVLLLLHQLGFMAEHFFHYLWPLLFIALGLWMIFRRVGDSRGGTQ